MYSTKERRFVVINKATIISIFVLILIGGVVRSSGVGMGCPDWPTCFGLYFPPANSSQLPENYKEKYVSRQLTKTEHFANTLKALGFVSLASEIKTNTTIHQPQGFNPFKIISEYVSGFVGIITALLMFICFAVSFTYIYTKTKIIFYSGLNLILIGFQLWLTFVEDSIHLRTWVITTHILTSLAILAISIYTYFLARKLREKGLLINRSPGVISILAIFTLVITIFQITLGSEVRESVDVISTNLAINRSDWVSKVGMNFNFHRDMAILVFSMSVVVFFMIKGKYSEKGIQYKYAGIVLILIVTQALVGASLAYISLPAIAQTLHILLASLLFAAEFYLILILQRNKLYLKKKKI